MSGFALETSLQQKSKFIFPSHTTPQNFVRISWSPSHAGQGSLISHNLWSQTLKLLELGVKGEARLLAAHSPASSQSRGQIPPGSPEITLSTSRRLETLLESISPAAASLPAWFMVAGRGNNNPWKKTGCRDASIDAASCFQSPSKREHAPSRTSEHPSVRISLHLSPQSWCLCPKDLKSCSAQEPRAHFPALWWLGLLGAQANTTNTVSLKPLQCRCCFHGN